MDDEKLAKHVAKSRVVFNKINDAITGEALVATWEALCQHTAGIICQVAEDTPADFDGALEACLESIRRHARRIHSNPGSFHVQKH